MGSSKTAGLALAIGALAILVAALVPSILGKAAGPEADILGQLKATEGRVLKLAVPGAPAPLQSQKHFYDRVSVILEGSQAATASTTLDFTGTFGGTKVSSLGAERVPFALKDGDWKPVHGLAPDLVGVVQALEARRQALQVGDSGQLSSLVEEGGAAGPSGWDLLSDRKLEARAWYIRVERGDVRVTEEYRLTGNAPERPVDEVGSKSLRLVPSGKGGPFKFLPPLF